MKRYERFLRMCAVALVPALITVALLHPRPCRGISREEVLVRAQTYCYHPWHCSSKNLTASCLGSYQSAYVPGDYFGLPYDWGGYVTMFQFDDGIENGYGAGSYSEHGVLGCTVGVDCSGFVSKVWDVGHYGTSTIEGVSHEITFGQVENGDAFNVPGYHIVLFGGEMADGWPIFYEAIGYNAQINATAGWANVDGFQPIRLDTIQDYSPGSDLGTVVNPIQVGKFPFVHDGDTTKSLSDLFDYYGADTSKKESGPEVIYQLEIDSPGKLTVSVQDGPGVDIDVHVCSALDTYHCIARHDSLIEKSNLPCGTWYVIADTWCNSSDTEFPGPYTLTIEFDKSGGSCSQTNEPYEFEGQPGDACGYPGNYNLPFCNPNLGGDICLYSDQPGQSFSFCTYNCKNEGACQDDFPGGCCADIVGYNDPQDFYCMTSAFCKPTPDPVDESPADPGAPDSTAQPDVQVTEEIVLQPDRIAPQPDAAWDSGEAGQDSVGGEFIAPGSDEKGGDPGGTDAGGPSAEGDGGGGNDGCSVGGTPVFSPIPPTLLALLLFLGMACARRRTAA